jgi:2,4-dienoyl-CoA reductase (NADPH2)
VTPRHAGIAGADHPKALNYVDVLLHRRPVGKRVAIVGAGGIGFDVAEFLVNDGHSPTLDEPAWLREWGIDATLEARGAVEGIAAAPAAPARQVFLLQRSPGKLGERLNKTTGWVHRTTLKKMRVEMIGGVGYRQIDDRGLHIEVGGAARTLEVDHVVICAGQVPNRALEAELRSIGMPTHLIGGADVAAELDAKRAIAQGTRLAASF